MASKTHYNILKFFLRLHNTTQTPQYTRTLTAMNTRTQTLPPMSTFEGLSRQILTFTKSPHAPHCRLGRRPPLNK